MPIYTVSRETIDKQALNYYGFSVDKHKSALEQIFSNDTSGDCSGTLHNYCLSGHYMGQKSI